MKRHVLRAGTIYEGDWLQAPLEPGYTLAILDGPYGIGKAGWDKMGIEGLADWYAPHLARVSALLAASASMYVWNTAEGWARLDPVVRGLGWTFRRLIVWDKRKSPESIGHAALTNWIDLTEACGFYTRGEPAYVGAPDAFNVWREFVEERLVQDEWRQRKAIGPRERVPLHPCQKPLLFAERMIRASTRPGSACSSRSAAPVGRRSCASGWRGRNRSRPGGTMCAS